MKGKAMKSLLIVTSILLLSSCTTVSRQFLGGTVEDAQAGKRNAQLARDHVGEQCAEAKVIFAEKSSALEKKGPFSTLMAARATRIMATEVRAECAGVIMDIQQVLLKFGLFGF